jgi:hypothetical protein
LLVERLLQDAGAVIAPELTRPRNQAAIAGKSLENASMERRNFAPKRTRETDPVATQNR